MPTLLIIEDNNAQREALYEFLSGQELFSTPIEAYAAPDIEIAQTILSERKIDIILSDLMLPDGRGVDLVEQVRKKNPHLPFLILTGQPSIESAIEAIRRGANDYLLKPVDFVLLQKKLETLWESQHLRNENNQLKQRLQQDSSLQIVGNAKVLHDVLEKVKQVAVVDVTVLIEGESGTGKEMIAEMLHGQSQRSGKELIKVNCGALTKTLLESELFGAVKGAYTGADKDRSGYFEAAHGGSIFLDEIGEMDLESQVRLLRVLEAREVVRVGSTKARSIDVRLLAATNKNLLQEVEKGNFREDLYYRLSVIKLSLPPLRERSEDIALLFNHFIIKFNDKYNKSVTGMSSELQKFFQAYAWPGNVRELHNLLEGMVVLAKEDILDMNDLPHELQNNRHHHRLSDNLEKSILTGVPLASYEAAILRSNLKFFNRNRKRTAQALGIAERTLYRKIQEYKL